MKKEKVLKVLDTFSDEVDVDTFLEKLYLQRKIEAGETQIAAGDLISHEDAKQRFKRWLA